MTQLILCDAFAGTEQHVAVLSRELDALGAQVRVVCGDRNAPLIEALRDSGVDVSPSRLGKGNVPVDWAEAYRSIAGWNPHIVHAHLGSSLLCAAILTRPRQKLLFTQHFIRPAYRDSTGIGPAVRVVAHRLVHTRVACALAATRLVRAELVHGEGFPPHKTAVVPLGIDVQRVVERSHAGGDIRAELGLPPDAMMLVTPARLEAVKGHETLLAALPRVLPHYPDAYLILAGGGRLEATLKERARALGVAGRVRFLGERRDVPRLVAQATLCVLPSYEDSFGLALLEAMALGTPVIACDSGGPREIVIDGETGLLVPPRDPMALADAIVATLDQPKRARAMGVAGQRRALERFSARRMAEQTMGVYGMVLGMPSPLPPGNAIEVGAR